MASISGITVTTVEGRVPDSLPQVELVTRPGVAGHGVVADASRAGEFTLVTGYAATNGAEAALATAYRALVDSVVEFDHDADGLRNVYVISVKVTPSWQVDGSVWVRAEWRLLEVSS